MVTFSVKIVVVKVLFGLNCLNSKYLLLEMNNNTAIDFEKTNNLKKEAFNSGLFRKKITFPENKEISSEKTEECESDKLKTQKKYTVVKEAVKQGNVVRGLTYTAFIEIDGKKEVMAKREVMPPGTCGHVRTEEGFARCGLSTVLTEYCFTDDDVGSIIISTNDEFNEPGMKEWKTKAMQNCANTVYINCSAYPVEACSGYLTAAIRNEHNLMYIMSRNDPETKMFEMLATVVQPEFRKGPQAWIDKYGKLYKVFIPYYYYITLPGKNFTSIEW